MAEDIKELSSVKAMFKKWDAKGSGTIDKDTLMKVLTHLVPDFTEEDITVLLQASSKSSDQTFAYEQLLEWIYSPPAVLVVDAGSTGSRLGLYSLGEDGKVTKVEASTRLPGGGWDESTFINPALADFMDADGDALKEMQGQFQQVLEKDLGILNIDAMAHVHDVIYVIGTSGIRNSPKAAGRTVEELTKAYNETYLVNVTKSLPSHPNLRCQFKVLCADEGQESEAWLEAMAAKMAATGMIVSGVMGCGGGSCQLTHLEYNFVVSTPLGSKNVLAGDAFTQFRDAFTEETEEAFVKAFDTAYANALGTTNAKFQALAKEPFSGNFIAMSGLSLGAKDAGLSDFVPDCMMGERSTLVDVATVKAKYLRFIFDVVRSEKTKSYQSAAGASVALWHLCKMFANDAQLFYAKRIAGVDFSVNVGFAYQQLIKLRGEAL